MSKKIFAFFSLLLVALSAYADDESQRLLKHLADTLDEMENYRIEFRVAISGGMDEQSGTYTASGSQYDVVMNNAEQFTDGEYLYQVNHSDKEVIVDNLSRNGYDMFDFTALFKNLPDNFNSEYRGLSEYEHIVGELICLTPKVEIDELRDVSVELYLSGDGMPEVLVFSQQGGSVAILIDSIERVTDIDESIFLFHKVKYPDYEIIDFR